MEFPPGTTLVFDRGYEVHKSWRRPTADTSDIANIPGAENKQIVT